MAESATENPFVVILNPQIGKRERIRQIRSHTTKGYYRKQKQEQQKWQQRRQQCPIFIHSRAPPSKSNLQGLKSEDVCPRLTCEVTSPIPFTCNALLDAEFLGAKMTRRVQQFFDVHMHANTHRHPWASIVMRWAIGCPFYMSAKLLQGSGWDDVHETGDISEWTVRQRVVTVRLLDDAFLSKAKLDMRVVGSTIQMLLGVELLIGDYVRFTRLKDFCHSLIRRSAQPNDMSWTSLSASLSLVDQGNRLRIAGSNSFAEALFPNETTVHFKSSAQFAFPMDASLFTFGQPVSVEDSHFIHLVLGDLYHIVFIAASSNTPVTQSMYEYIASQHERVLPFVPTSILTTDEGIISSELEDDTNLRVLPLQLSIFLITSCLLFGDKGDQRLFLAAVASRLRSLLTKLGASSEYYDIDLTLFPGALVWCYAIGVRFSDPQRDQKWFLLQFLRTTQAWLPAALDEMSKNARMIVDCLENIRQMSVEDITPVGLIPEDVRGLG